MKCILTCVLVNKQDEQKDFQILWKTARGSVDHVEKIEKLQ